METGEWTSEKALDPSVVDPSESVIEVEVSGASLGDAGVVGQFVKRLRWWQRQGLALILGQCLSICITCTGITSESLETFYSVDIPTTQSFLNYLLLSVVYTCISLRDRSHFWSSLKDRWWIMLLLAFIDVEANYLIVSAYQFTSITSAMLLDCFTIPCVMILSLFILHERFGVSHVLAVSICICGLVALMFSDGIQDENDPGEAIPFQMYQTHSFLRLTGGTWGLPRPS